MRSQNEKSDSEKSIFDSQSWIDMLEKLRKPMKVMIENSRKCSVFKELQNPTNDIPGRVSKLSSK